MTNLSLEPGKTYIIDNDIILTEDLLLPENITLIFQGGMFKSESEVKVIGNNTTLIAPIAPIFGINVSATGSWLIDCAYPQWFEATTFKFDDTVFPDIAESIQRAIKMKGTGKVYLITDNYYLTKPLFIPLGIELCGTPAQPHGNTYPQNYAPTQIFPACHNGRHYESDIKYKYDYLVYINTDYGDYKGFNYPNPWTAIQGITFINYPKIHPTARCIYSSGGIRITNVNWSDFIQAIECRDFYSDGKSITNCVFHALEEISSDISDDGIYAFNLGGLGDALEFRHNQIGGNNDRHRMLRLHECGGGIIDGNVINGDVSISASKAITYANNHMEYGAQIIVEESVVSFKENYIEKGARPSILIRCTENGDLGTYNMYGQNVVSMCGDQFIYFNRNRNDKENANNGMPIKELRLSSISETDILIDRSAILSLENVYRYDCVVVFGAVNPLGIKIDTFADNPLFRFNDFSYFMSEKGTISRNEQLRSSAAFHRLNLPLLYAPMLSEWVEWFHPSGRYSYSYSIIWDKTRAIYRNVNGNIIFPLTETPLNLSKYSDGVQIGTGIFSGTNAEGLDGGYNYMIQLFRHMVDESGAVIPGTEETVYLPLAGSKTIYDNGISICGYKWVPITENNTDRHNIPVFETFSYQDGHVEASSTAKIGNPSPGWLSGDVINNIGNDTSWTTEIIK